MARSSAAGRADAVMIAIDLVHLDGEDLRDRPLEERLARLAGVAARGDPWLQLSPEMPGDGPEVLARRLRARPRGHRLEAARLALRLRQISRLAQDEVHDDGAFRGDRHRADGRPRAPLGEARPARRRHAARALRLGGLGPDGPGPRARSAPRYAPTCPSLPRSSIAASRRTASCAIPWSASWKVMS